jgi:hypothetical protein
VSVIVAILGPNVHKVRGFGVAEVVRGPMPDEERTRSVGGAEISWTMLVVARRAGLSHVATVADLVLAVRAYSGVLYAPRCEHPSICIRDEGPAVLTFRHLRLHLPVGE